MTEVKQAEAETAAKAAADEEQAQVKAAAKKAKKQRQKAKQQAQAEAQQTLHRPSTSISQQLMPEAQEAQHKLHPSKTCSEAQASDSPALQQPALYTQISAAQTPSVSVNQCCAASPAAEPHTPCRLPEQHRLQQSACSIPDNNMLFRQRAADSYDGCSTLGPSISGGSPVRRYTEVASNLSADTQTSATERQVSASTIDAAATDLVAAVDTAAAPTVLAMAGSVSTAKLAAADTLVALDTADARGYATPDAAGGHSARADTLHRKCTKASDFLQQWAQCPITQVSADALLQSINCLHKLIPYSTCGTGIQLHHKHANQSAASTDALHQTARSKATV